MSLGQRQQKLVWAEGLFLGQQHFQVWEKALQREMQQRSRVLNPNAWGLLSIRLVPEALENGQCRLETVTAIFPDGRLVEYDSQADGGPLLCDLAGDDPEVWLALPDNDGVSDINGYQTQGRLSAWRAEYHDIVDEHDPSRSREVIVGRPNLALLRGDESREHFSAIPIGRFESRGDGRYVPGNSFVPPLVCIGASEALIDWLVKIQDLLAARVRQLAQQRNSYGDLSDMGSRELGQFLRLQHLRPILAVLGHILQQGTVHPEVLYLELLRLIAGLRDFQADMPELTFPEYRHLQLGSVFEQLENALRESLVESSYTPSTALSLHAESPALMLGEGIPWGMLDKQHLYLGVYLEADDPHWITDFAKQTKCGSREDLELILASALPGIRLTHTQRPPNRLPVKSGFEYFRFEPSGEFWPRAVESESLAIFLPGQFQSARLELLCVEE